MRPLLSLVLLATAACQTSVVDGGGGNGNGPSTPANLSYELEPSGDANRPLGILLFWDDVTDANLASYRIYSRASSSGSFDLRGETTSNTFHDNGVPHLQYLVTAVDDNGNESGGSNMITVDERLQLDSAAWLTSISLNGAIHLEWDDSPYLSAPTRFKWYRIYSTDYDPDARNTLVYAYNKNQPQSGFRFWQDVNGDGRTQASELGLVQDGNLTSIDFWVYQDPADSTLWLVPGFSGTRVSQYGTGPVADLTSIDYAPLSGYTRNMIQAVPGYGYVFEIVEGTTLRYGALRVTHVGRDYMIFDWSFQTDPGNPELQIRAGQSVAMATGTGVSGSK